MKKYCAFLRQVSFHKKFIQMSKLRTLFEEMGFDSVDSVLATGNIIFTSDKAPDELCSLITEKLSKYFSYFRF